MVGERCRKLKFFLRFHQDPSMSSSKQRVKGVSLHLHTTCRSRVEACQGDGDDGVVLERDSDHRCLSAERTAPPRSTHVRDGRRLLRLDPARRKERLRKAAPTAARRRGVVGAAVLRQGFAKHVRRRRGVGEGRGCALACVKLPCASPLYIGVEGLVSCPPSPLGRWPRWEERNLIISFPTDCYPPFLGILILSLRDMILFLLRGDLGAP